MLYELTTILIFSFLLCLCTLDSILCNPSKVSVSLLTSCLPILIFVSLSKESTLTPKHSTSSLTFSKKSWFLLKINPFVTIVVFNPIDLAYSKTSRMYSLYIVGSPPTILTISTEPLHLRLSNIVL